MGETAGIQSIQTFTGTVTEERSVEETPLSTWEQALWQVEEIPPSTQEQVLWCLSPERCEVIGQSSKCAGKACQWEAAEEPPQDYTSDQEETKDKESSSEANWRADQMEFIRKFQEIMDKAIEQLLNKPARRHSHWKEKPELHTEQGKHRESICQEAEKLPQHCERQQISTIMCCSNWAKRPLCQVIWHSLWALYKQQFVTYSPITAMVYDSIPPLGTKPSM